MNFYKITESMLYNYKSMHAELKNIDLEIEELKNYSGISAMNYDEKAAPTNKFNSTVENEMLARMTKPDQLEYRKHKLEIQIKKIDNALETLTEEEMHLIELRYFDKLQFKIIAQRIGISEMYCVQYKSRIIKKLIKLIIV